MTELRIRNRHGAADFQFPAFSLLSCMLSPRELLGSSTHPFHTSGGTLTIFVCLKNVEHIFSPRLTQDPADGLMNASETSRGRCTDRKEKTAMPGLSDRTGGAEPGRRGASRPRRQEPLLGAHTLVHRPSDVPRSRIRPTGGQRPYFQTAGGGQ